MGARGHYTHEADILKTVTPTIVRPWRERIDATGTPAEARALLDELCAFRVLDPACGCGNFLYVVYRELRGLESDIKRRIHTLAAEKGLPVPPGPWPYYPITNLYGLDIERVAVLIARVALWMGHRQMIEVHGEAEDPLPLVDLTGIEVADALRTSWPEVDVIIGNPPFLGSQYIRRALGADYVDWLKREFNVGVKDLCTYWFRRAHDHLEPGQRAGLVGTNSISQNRGRAASLDYIATNGGVITDAVSSQKWPGEAKVHVSLVNWIKDPVPPPEDATLNGAEVRGITTSLTAAGDDDWTPKALPANVERCFQGPIPVGAGFIVTAAEARALLARTDATYRDVVRPYLTGEDITDSVDQGPRRWIIDFANLPLERAMGYPAALEIVRDRVKPERDRNARNARRERWWQFGEKAIGMRTAIARQEEWIGSLAFGKRFFASWQEGWTCPSGKIYVFAFEDDFSMGVLLSRAHIAWAWARSGTLETRLSYTPTSAFMTFPWPDPVTAEQRDRIAAASRAPYTRRSELCQEHDMGLTKLYNLMDDGAFTDLAALHRVLDEAAVDAYGWPASIAQDDGALVRHLTQRNRDIAEGVRTYAPFG